jgi:ATP-binding cassette subfamily B protein
MRGTFDSWVATAVRPRMLLFRLLPDVGTGLLAVAMATNLALGLLPVGFVVATSVVVGQVPDAVAGGVGSAAWDELVAVFLLATAAFIGQQALAPVQTALNVRIKRTVDGRNLDRILALTLGSVSIAPMEDPATLDAVEDAAFPYQRDFATPGEAVGGFLALVARYLRVVGFGVIVGVLLAWWAGIAVVVATMVFRYGQRGGLRKYSQVWTDVVPVRRRAQYLRDTAMGAGAAKEARIYGLTGWLAERHGESHNLMYGLVARRRREVYLVPFVVFTAVGLTLTAAVLVAAARAGAAGELDLTALALVLQSTTAALLLGSYYIESDVPTQFGMLAASAKDRLEARVAGEPTLDAGPTVVSTDRVGTAPASKAPSSGSQPSTSLPSTSLRFEGLTFGYRGSERLVLDGFDLELPAGRSTAVVGVNGAGKTTLVKLLTRLYEPTAGRITVHGADVAGLDPVAWRRQVSVIFQDFARYELSAADNIAFGAAHLPRDNDAVRDAAARAGILSAFEHLPDGLDTVLDRAYPGGVDLSGGQWQRIAIARSLYALAGGATVLVLDEPTSALDVRAEVAFFDRFVELTRGVTSVLISHRFSSVRRADRIVVIDGGRVVEQGTHTELMAADGHYARLFRLQAERFAAGLDAEGNDTDGLGTDGLDTDSGDLELDREPDSAEAPFRTQENDEVEAR